MREQWLLKVAHIHAQDAAVFFLYLIGVIVVTLWLARNE